MVGAYVAQFVAGVDEVLYMLSARNPLKAPYPMTDGDRLSMLRSAVAPYPFLSVSTLELTMPRPSYTIDTLRRLEADHPEARFRLLVGSDNILAIDRWREYGEILSRYGVLVYPRPGFKVTASDMPPGATLIEGAPEMWMSSTFIREGIASGRDMRPFLPAGVNITR